MDALGKSSNEDALMTYDDGDRDQEARDTVLREIDGAIEALTELRALIPAAGTAGMIEAERESGNVLHHIGQLARALDLPTPRPAA